ncbi:hypothetical protein [Collimonas fungivorans]|uniref:hypothetical protein n=1 Tax=Collimonas fungivorans TaxID=158899 RepID=UPI0012375DE6|nr:hypothetical protein [Collimonas fungivorans]
MNEGLQLGKFTKSVQDGEIPGPLRTEFKVKQWRAKYALLDEGDDDDRSLFDAGLMIHDKADHIRSNLKVTFSENFRATTKIRAFAALANYNYCRLIELTHEAFSNAAAKQRELDPDAPIMMHELVALKLKLAVGAEFGPDEIVQAMVDGMEVPLKRILEKNPNLSGNPEFAKLDWDDMSLDFNLGNLWAHIEGLWDDCLWNKYIPTQKGRATKFAPKEDIWQLRYVVSRVRFNSLAREFAMYSLKFQKNLIYRGVLKLLAPMNVKALSKDGRRQVIQMSAFDPGSSDIDWLLTMRAYASEPYYKELLQEPQAKLFGATLDHVLVAWGVVSRASSVLRKGLALRKVEIGEEAETWLPTYASVLQVPALVRAVSIACGIDLSRSKALIDFFMFHGKSDQELWAQPLLPVSKDAVIPIFATTSSPNLRRLVDVWMKQLGVDLSLRGPAFEEHIRATIRTNIAQSPMLSASKCLERGVKFTAPNEREEEIDFVAMIGNIVIVGEVKCFLDPAEAKQTAMHRMKVIDAVTQVRRKADTVREHKEAFRVRAFQLGLELPVQFDVLPIVVLNSAIHCGFAVDGVPIVDEHILGVFFRGELVEMAISGSDGELTTVKKRVLYSSITEAAESAANYFSFPPQMEMLLAGVGKRWVPIPAVGEADWDAQFLALECVPKLPPSYREEATLAGLNVN